MRIKLAPNKSLTGIADFKRNPLTFVILIEFAENQFVIIDIAIAPILCCFISQVKL